MKMVVPQKVSVEPYPMPWPPLVKANKVPVQIQVRDFLLTLVAWGVFGWMMLDALHLGLDWLRPPFGELTHLTEPDWAAIWMRLRPFVELTGVMMIWICFWAVYRRKTLRPHLEIPEAPLALDPELLCNRYAVSMLQLTLWQQSQCVTVDVIEGGRIIPVDIRDSERRPIAYQNVN